MLSRVSALLESRLGRTGEGQVKTFLRGRRRFEIRRFCVLHSGEHKRDRVAAVVTKYKTSVYKGIERIPCQPRQSVGRGGIYTGQTAAHNLLPHRTIFDQQRGTNCGRSCFKELSTLNTHFLLISKSVP